MIKIPVGELEIGENTIWIHSPLGGTVLRIKTMGQIITQTCRDSPVSHADILIRDNIHICLAEDAVK